MKKIITIAKNVFAVIGIIGTILGIVSFISGVPSIPWINEQRHPISVEPNEFPILGQPWDINTTFIIQNKINKRIYGITIAFWLANSGVESKNIDIDTPNNYNPWEEFLPNTKLYVSYDFVRCDGTDVNGQQFVLLFIHHVDPDSFLPCYLKITTSSNQTLGNNAKVRLEVTGYSKNPIEPLKSDVGYFYPFGESPVSGTITSITLKRH